MLPVVNYVVVGGAILYWHSNSADSESALASKLAEGSYACLYLVNALSVVISSFKGTSEALGLARRVEDLLLLLPEPGGEEAEEGEEEAEGQQRATSSHVISSFLGLGITLSTIYNDGWKTIWPVSEPLSYDYRLLNSDIGSGINGSAVEMATQQSEKSSRIVSNEDITLTTVANDPVVLEIKDLNLTSDYYETGSAFTTNKRLLVSHLSLQLYRGMRLMISGPSGCGKSTLLRYISSALRNADFNTISTRKQSIIACAGHIKLNIPLEHFIVCPQTPYFCKVKPKWIYNII